MSRKKENTGFVCVYCRRIVSALTNGSYRNHCPHCLYSLHIDIKIGDRLNNCLGLMKPIKIMYRGNKGYQIVHKCLICGLERTNKVAEYTDMPDNLSVILELMVNI